MTDPLYLRIEPGRPDIDEGMRARAADPVWFLARQWQLGEQHGEDASSPVVIDVTPSHVPIAYDPARPDLDPTVVPAEALVEAEPGDWWTVGRRIRLGRAAGPLLDPPTRSEFFLRDAGGALRPARWRGRRPGRVRLGCAGRQRDLVGGSVPVTRPLVRDQARLRSFLRGRWDGPRGARPCRWGCRLVHGRRESAAVAAPPPGFLPPTPRQVIPGRLDYPGAPNPRWWQIEDRAVDIGGFAPDRSHLATMLLIDVALAHSDDWFQFAVPPPFGSGQADPPSSGVLVRLSNVTVKDSFEQVWPLAAPPATGPGSVVAVPHQGPA